MSNEPEMTKETARGCTPLSAFYRHPVLVQGLSWLGSFGVLSSGLVWAKNEPTAKTVVVPTISKAQPTVIVKAEPVVNAVPKPAANEAITPKTPERQKAPVVAHQPAPPEQHIPTVVVQAIPVPALAHKDSASEQHVPTVVVQAMPVLPKNPEAVVAGKPSESEPIQIPVILDKPGTQVEANAPGVVDKNAAGESTIAASVPKLQASFPPTLYVPTKEEATATVASNETPANPKVNNENKYVAFDASNYRIGLSDGEDVVIPAYQKPGTVAQIAPSTSCKTELKGVGMLPGICGAIAPIPETAYNTPPVPVAHLPKATVKHVASIDSINLGPIHLSARGISFGNDNRDQGAIASNTTTPDTSSILAGLLATGNASMIYPLSIPVEVTSPFGWRIHPISGDRRFHAGTDLGAPMGTPVLAAATGQVVSANWMGGYGKAIVIQHNQTQETLYGHLSEINVQPGQWITQGTVIGRSGSTGNSTGPHLHFEIRQRTNEGWVATDSGTPLKYAEAQLINAIHAAQAQATALAGG